MDNIVLKKPTKEYENQVMAYREIFLKNNEPLDGCACLEEINSYNEWLDFEGRFSKKYGKDYVPSQVYLAIRQNDNKLIGIIDLRIKLSEFLFKFGGNIGYSIRPTERGKGYNNINLYLGLKFCNKHNIEEVLLDADLENPASWKTMEAMGGMRIREYFDEEHDHTMTVDYKINVKNALIKCVKYEEFIVSND